MNRLLKQKNTLLEEKMESYIFVTDEEGERIVNENGLTLLQNITGKLSFIFE